MAPRSHVPACTSGMQVCWKSTVFVGHHRRLRWRVLRPHTDELQAHKPEWHASFQKKVAFDKCSQQVGEAARAPRAHEETARAPLLKQAHERRAQRLIVGCGHLLHASLVQHEAAVHRLELQVLDHVRVHQHAHLRPGSGFRGFTNPKRLSTRCSGRNVLGPQQRLQGLCWLQPEQGRQRHRAGGANLSPQKPLTRHSEQPQHAASEVSARFASTPTGTALSSTTRRSSEAPAKRTSSPPDRMNLGTMSTL